MAVPARVAALCAWCVFVVLVGVPGAYAQTTFKVAYINIQSGKGEPGLPGHPVLFADTANCTDPSQPLNGWGVGFVQPHLLQAVGADPAIVALGLGEAWTCGSDSNIRQLLGWRAQSTGRNGVALLARHGFAGPEEWVQLDTSTNLNPIDTMWVLRVPVCLDLSCTRAVDVFTAHWYADVSPYATYDQWRAAVPATLDRQAGQTVDFLRRAGGGAPHLLIGDLNTWESPQQTVCSQYTPNAGLNRLRDAGYIDAWPLLHGGAEGFTGMTNRPRCGVPEGYAWKRIDYVWSPAHFLPVSMSRFGVVAPGDPAPSDHYGIIAEFPLPGVTLPPSPPPPPSPPTQPPGAGDIVLYAGEAVVTGTAWQVMPDPLAAGGSRIWNPDRGAPKRAAPLASPADFIELTFDAIAGVGYHLWVRGKAEHDSWTNDSIFLQFSGSVTQAGAAVHRIGTAAAMVVSIEEGSGAGLLNWGWQDDVYGGPGIPVYFAASGPQRIRIQQREDGVSLDQVILSPTSFFSIRPGATRNDATIYEKTGSTTPTSPPPAGPTDPPPAGPTDIILRAADATSRHGRWQRVTDSSAAGSARLWIPDAGVPKLTQAVAQPADYFELTFEAVSGMPYRLWIRGSAERDAWTNDSMFVQFSGSVTAGALPVWRIGSTDATVVSIEEGAGAGLSGWGWADNGYGLPGPTVAFAATGPQTIRVQSREDGVSIDQIVLSPERYLTSAPGLPRNDSTILR